MIRRPPRSTLSSSSAASDVYKRQGINAEYGGTNPSTMSYVEAANPFEASSASSYGAVTGDEEESTYGSVAGTEGRCVSGGSIFRSLKNAIKRKWKKATTKKQDSSAAGSA
eukprot:TRINITY_DN19550_c0_g1_i4.p2 TRINITY_DN19550_c0_g1~~TRINITY_DN19550_c0_g1_i4.p2  ORF type:complete len:111 (-),score=34.84 TRINITY_DN19550_c0_g1_i4:484-816(-)